MKLMILDGNSIVNRAFYGIRLLTAPDGTPTNGVYGFLTILNRLIEQEQPESLCVAFDLKAPTFRHEQYAEYKAGRKPMPEDLAVQIPLLKEVLDALGICRLELEGYEADDIIGTVAANCEKNGDDCIVVTGDKDSFQLISETTTVKHVKSRMGKTETTDYTPEVFREEYGFAPPGIIDLKALMGDSSDNIPGVKGVGEKTAMSLIQTYGTLEKVYENLDSSDIKDSLRGKLLDGRDMARLSFELATIIRNVPIGFDPAACAFSGFGGDSHEVLKRLGFNTLIEKWGISPGAGAEKDEKKPRMPEIEPSGEEEFSALADRIKALPYVALFVPEGDLDRLSICDGDRVYLLRRMNAAFSYDNFLNMLFSEHIKKVSHNVKDVLRLLLSENLNTDGFLFDTALGAYLLDPTESNYDLRRISAKYAGAEADGAQAVFALYEPMKRQLEQENMTKLFEEIELPLCHVLADMELRGFALDKKALYDFGQILSVRIEQLQAEIWELAGEEFNISSPKQLGEILFEKLALPSGKKTKTGWSTNVDVLEGLKGKHPIIDTVLEYRQLTKLKSTYADGLLKVIAPDGRVRTSFQMTVTATGRLSSTEPNLQNIPVRSELGAQIRKMFVSEPGKVLVDADYSQIELRLLAHISGDKTMINAFQNKEDIHTVTASQVFGVPLDRVTSLQRSHAKAVNFGIVYGISAFSLAQDIGVYQNEAKAYIEAYLSKYSGVRQYMKDVVAKAKEDGYVSTLFGRKRPLPELKSSNFNIRSFGERVALNMPIQGTAADIIKLAMVNAFYRLKAEKLNSKLILQVHDELICECPEAEAERVRQILIEEMENAFRCSVELTVDAHIGKTWNEAK